MKTWLEIDNKVGMDNAHWNEKSQNARIFLSGCKKTPQNFGTGGFRGRRI